MIRLCHVITTLDPGGAENALCDLALGLKDIGYQQDIVYLKGQGQLGSFFQKENIPVTKINMESFSKIFSAKTQLMAHTKNHHLIHSHLLKANSLAAMACSALPLVGSRHNDESILNNPFIHFLHKHFSRKEKVHIAISQAVKCFYTNKGLEAEKFKIIPYGLTPPLPLSKTNLRNELKVPSDHTLLLHAGRLVPQKGQCDLLQAMVSLPKLTLALCGTGELEATLKQQSQQLGLNNRVHFLGFRNDLHDLMASSDLFVLPSHWEGLGRVLLEAMAVGLPIVSTQVSAIPEVLGDTAWLCPPNNPEALAASIRTALEEKESWPHKIEKMAQRLTNNFSIDFMIKAHDDIYRSIING